MQHAGTIIMAGNERPVGEGDLLARLFYAVAIKEIYRVKGIFLTQPAASPIWCGNLRGQ